MSKGVHRAAAGSLVARQMVGAKGSRALTTAEALSGGPHADHNREVERKRQARLAAREQRRKAGIK